MAPRFTVEPFMDTAREAWPLILEHAEEVGLGTMGAPFQPRWDGFHALDDAGLLLTVTARDEDSAIIGYAVWVIAPSLLHADLTVGQNESLFFRKGYRNPYDVLRFLKFCEDALRRRGCRLLVFDSWADDRKAGRKDLAPLMRRSGFKRRKIGYWKQLPGE